MRGSPEGAERVAKAEKRVSSAKVENEKKKMRWDEYRDETADQGQASNKAKSTVGGSSSSGSGNHKQKPVVVVAEGGMMQDQTLQHDDDNIGNHMQESPAIPDADTHKDRLKFPSPHADT